MLRDSAGLKPSAPCIAAGDADCDGSRDAVDALRILRHVADLPPLTVPSGCPPLGSPLPR